MRVGKSIAALPCHTIDTVVVVVAVAMAGIVVHTIISGRSHHMLVTTKLIQIVRLNLGRKGGCHRLNIAIIAMLGANPIMMLFLQMIVRRWRVS